jgi:hypothetical protein
MESNLPVLRKKQEISAFTNKKILPVTTPVVKYALVDTSRYSFEYQMNDDVDVAMYESDRIYDSDEFVDADFEASLPEKDYSYYVVAVASGIITGTFSNLKLSKENIEKINEWKNKDWDKYVMLAAQMAGYSKSDVKGAMSFLKKRIVPFVDESLQDEVKSSVDILLKQLSSHPSLAGLVFAIFTQFSGKKYSFDEGGISSIPVPDYYAIGRNVEEKLVYGLLYWILYLAVNVAVSKRNILDDIKIPKEVIKVLKELYKLPMFSSFPHSYDDVEKLYSEWIVNIFEKTKYTDESGDEKKFDLKETIEQIKQESIYGSILVVINECIVRSFYLIKKLIEECKNKRIATFADLSKVDTDKILPFNNRLVSRMVLISSGCFVGINVAGATLKYIANHKNNGENFSKTLLTEINIAGVGRFVFAVVADSKYWGDDIKMMFQRRDKNKKVDDKVEVDKIVNDMMSNEAFSVLLLNPIQTRALYSLESLLVEKDIEHTKSSKAKENKYVWLETWQKTILEGLEIESPNYFVTDEKIIYDSFNKIEHSEEEMRWFYLMAMELALFDPYNQLGSEHDSEFKKLQCEKYNYIDDQFIRRQTIISQAEIDNIRDNYKKYKNVISGSVKNTMIVVGVTTVTAIATGGLALSFAPGIATLIAGEAVAGLHGAALTSASLALVGGGSLAAGGLGMAGGTAIITGGGALLGVTSSGSASMAAILTQTSSDYWLRQTTKMLVFCKCILKDKLGLTDSIKKLADEMTNIVSKVEANINELEQEKCSLDKAAIKSSKECLKYLKKCKVELDKLLN